MARRKLDRFGRLVIPKDYRKELNFEKGQMIELTIEYGKICIKAFDGEINLKPYLGIVKRLDDHLGRVGIPKEYLEILNMDINSYYEIWVENSKVIVSNQSISSYLL